MKILLGQNIRKYRHKLGITQRALARLLHVTVQTVSKWECERSYPDPAMILRIAEIFDVSLDELFGRSVGK